MRAHGAELLAEATRGGVVESRHLGHAVVVDAEGRVLYAAGDPQQRSFPRSSLKPLQSLAAIARGTADRYGYTDSEIAVTCASHSAEPRHRTAVASILEKIGCTEADLHCGAHPVPHLPSRDELILSGREPTPIYSNCSGKHSGMLALARLLGAPTEGYWTGDHPVQLEIQQVLRHASGMDLGSLHWGIDGCGVPTFHMSTYEMALGFARLCRPESLPDGLAPAAERITTAMNREPEMVRGEGGFDSVLMRALPGVAASKGGAEGYQCVGLVGRGIGIAIKVDDGSARALAPLMLALMRMFDALPADLPAALQPLIAPTVLNTRGVPVGEVRSVLPAH